MAETLGSLIDKLSIKNLRYWHLGEDAQAKDASNPQKEELASRNQPFTSPASQNSLKFHPPYP